MMSAKTAQEWRLEGNGFFQQQKYGKALDYYTQSVLASSKARFHGSANDDLPLAYANRSAALYHMENYKVCLQDIELALDHGYPQHLHYKLYQRKGLCLLHLGKYEAAASELRGTLQLMEAMATIDEQKKAILKAEVEKHLEKCQQRNLVTSDQCESSSSARGFTESPCVANAIGSVSLRYNKTEGRHLVANSLIGAGSVIIQEIPYGSVLLADYYESHCHFCYKQLVAPVPCSKCPWVLYCSKPCLRSAREEYHSVECSHWELLQQLGTFAWVSLRIALKARKDGDLLQVQDDDVDQDAKLRRIPGCEADGTYKASYHAVCCLMPNTSNHTEQELLSCQQKAGTLARHFSTNLLLNDDNQSSIEQSPHQDINSGLSNLAVDSREEVGASASLPRQESCNATTGEAHRTTRTDIESTCHQDQKIKKHRNKELPDLNMSDFAKAFDSIEEKKHPESGTDIKILIERLTLHMQQLKCNAHAITAVRNVPQRCRTGIDGEGRNDAGLVDSTEQVRLATAVYPTASLMNHSCEPNVIASFHGKQLTVRAIKDIEKDEEILHCYGPHAKHMDTSERRTALQEQYFFTCHCTACDSNPAKLAKETSCDWSKAFKCPQCEGPVTRKGRVQVRILKCEQCQQDIDINVLEKQETKASLLFAQAIEYLHRNDFEKCLPLLKQCYKIRTKVLYKHHKDIAETQDCIARCYASVGDFKEAGKHLEASVATIGKIYGENSIEVANELHKMAQVFFNGREVKKALNVTEKALQLFTMHYGKNHESLEELQQMKMCLLQL